MRINQVRTHYARRFVPLLTGLSVLLSCLFASPACAAEPNEECPTGLLPAIDEFLENVNKVSLTDPIEDREQRLLSYEIAIRDLVREARRFYGPFCPCSEILRDAMAYIENAERIRTPPPGWDPKASLQNLLDNTDNARRSLMLQLRLTAWGWMICKYR
ncbi:MAG: hypothetical protein LDL33_04920 [Desulfomonile sp.]|nr:hypothetical protein [Desulfomonile sp.]